MPREKKPQQVDEVYHERLGITVPIMLNRNTLEFYAEYEGDRIEARSAQEVKQQVEDLVRGGLTAEWQPVLKVQVTTPRDYAMYEDVQGSLGIKFRRYWVGFTPTGKTLQCEWNTPAAERRSAAKKYTELVRPNEVERIDFRSLPAVKHEGSSWHQGSDTYFLDYTEEMWAALNAIVAQLEKACDTLEQLLGTEEGRDRVMQVGAALLPAVLMPGQRHD